MMTISQGDTLHPLVLVLAGSECMGWRHFQAMTSKSLQRFLTYKREELCAQGYHRLRRLRQGQPQEREALLLRIRQARLSRGAAENQWLYELEAARFQHRANSGNADHRPGKE